MPIVLADEPQTSKPRRRWLLWLVVSLGAALLAALLALVVVPFFKPLEFTVGGNRVLICGDWPNPLAYKVPPGFTHLSSPVGAQRAWCFRFGAAVYFVATTPHLPK
ncbi:MAG: hypothetical protein ACK47B_27915 [Armatimonadota bacterium]